MSHGCSHCVDLIVDELFHKMHAQQHMIHITTAYAAWTNGVVECMNKTLLDAMRPILSDGWKGHPDMRSSTHTHANAQ